MTLLAILWTLFSGFGIFDFIDAHRTLTDPNAALDYAIWGIHALVMVLAVCLHRREPEVDVLAFDLFALPSPIASLPVRPIYAVAIPSVRPVRRQYAELLRHFATGLIDVDTFETWESDLREFEAPEDSKLLHDAFMLAWSQYDDFRTEHLRGCWKLQPDARRIVARMILFLMTDQPYAWTAKEIRNLDATQPGCYWPFLDRARFDAATANPILLSGRN